MMTEHLRILSFFLLTVFALTSRVDAHPEHTVGQWAQDFVISTADGREVKLSSLRGQWVLLATGHANCRGFQGLLVCFRHILKRLEGSPVRFVEVLKDPSFQDSALFSSMPALGLRGMPSNPLDLDSYGAGRFPEWFLIDPEGVVRAAGRNIASDSLRKRLSKAWKNDPSFEGVTLDPTPDEVMLENSNHAYIDDDYEKGRELGLAYLERHPADESAIRLLYYLEVWTEGYPESLKNLKQRMESFQPSEPLQIFLEISQARTNYTYQSRQALRDWLQRYPESRYLQAIQRARDILPESLTPSDRALITSATKTDLKHNLRVALAFAHMQKGNDPLAERLLRNSLTNQHLDPLLQVLVFSKLGQEEYGRSLIGLPEDLSPETAEPSPVWKKLHLEAALQNWEEAAIYAARYAEVRPKWIQGHLMAWLASKLLDHEEKAVEYKNEALRLVSTGDRYPLAKACLAENRYPSVDEIERINDLHIRFDTGLLAVLLRLDREDEQAAIRQADQLQTAYLPNEWCAIIFHQIRRQALPSLVFNPEIRE